ncbi:DUF4238 domain-containing protein [Nocardia rhamnosiphila]
MQRWLSDSEIQRSKDIAAAAPSDSWRHHFVPETYLKRWVARRGGRLRYRDLSTGRGGYGAPKAVAHQPHFYRYSSPGEPELWVETHLGRVENDAADLLRQLDSLPDGPIADVATTSDLAVFVGLQSQRTPRVRATNIVVEQWNPSGRDQQTAAIDMAIYTWRESVVPHLAGRSWSLASSSAPLITCDEPAIPIGYPGWTRQRRLSFITTAILLFPIGPHRLVVAGTSRPHVSVQAPFKLSDAETDAVNLEIAANCLQYIYEQDTEKDLGAQLSVPPLPDRTDGHNGQNIFTATSLPTRWASLNEPPPWPMSRWVVSTPPLLRAFAAGSDRTP